MTDEKRPCPICGKGPAAHHGTECPFLTYAVSPDWNRLVGETEEFVGLHADHPCPVCGRNVGVWGGYDAGAGGFGIEVACGCTRVDAGCVAEAIHLWLNRHQDAYRRVLDANKLARRVPGADVDVMPMGEPVDWVIRYESDGIEQTDTIAAYDPREARRLLVRDEPSAHVLGVRRSA